MFVYHTGCFTLGFGNETILPYLTSSPGDGDLFPRITKSAVQCKSCWHYSLSSSYLCWFRCYSYISVVLPVIHLCYLVLIDVPVPRSIFFMLANPLLLRPDAAKSEKKTLCRITEKVPFGTLPFLGKSPWWFCNCPPLILPPACRFSQFSQSPWLVDEWIFPSPSYPLVICYIAMENDHWL